jgi:hypothetical protein
MKVKLMAILAGSVVLIGLTYMASAGDRVDQSAVVAAEVGVIAKHLSQHPTSALDLSKVSGEYCFNAKLGKGSMMVHFAIDPDATTEDVITFYNAAPLLKAGLKGTELLQFCGKLGCMESDKWYYLPAGEYEPHHAVKFPFPLLIKAMDII